MRIRIQTTDSRMYYTLGHTMPENAVIVSSPPMLTKALDVSVSVNIDIAIDITKISCAIVAAWVYKNISMSKGRSDVYVDEKKVSVDQSEIEKELQKAIEHQEAGSRD